jgi:hypothetical protein
METISGGSSSYSAFSASISAKALLVISMVAQYLGIVVSG